MNLRSSFGLISLIIVLHANIVHFSALTSLRQFCKLLWWHMQYLQNLWVGEKDSKYSPNRCFAKLLATVTDIVPLNATLWLSTCIVITSNFNFFTTSNRDAKSFPKPYFSIYIGLHKMAKLIFDNNDLFFWGIFPREK